MLFSFGAENFYCFKEPVVIDLKLNSKVPKGISSGKPAARALCLKGANASGKTNAVKILNFLSEFCTNSFSAKPEADIEIDSFFGNTNPIKLFVEFTSGETLYRYELSLTRNEVISEKIYKKDKRKILIFDRSQSRIITNSLSTRKDFPLRKNASIISILKQYEDESISPIYGFFFSIYTNVTAYGFRGQTLSDEFVAGFYKRNPEVLKFAIELISRFDTGIANVEIRSYDDKDGNKIYYPLFEHYTSEGPKFLGKTSQSSGTTALFNALLWYSFALRFGGILALDEFDINLHPDILPHLIGLFEDETINTKDSQIIISTHNNEVIDLLGKYRTYLFNKRDGESFGYRVDEIESDIIRNDRPLLPIYLSGKLGGTPRIGVINVEK